MLSSKRAAIGKSIMRASDYTLRTVATHEPAFLSQIPARPDTLPKNFLETIKGDLFVKSCKFSEAIACYDDVIKDASIEDQIVLLFRKAWVYLSTNELSQAIANAIKATELWLTMQRLDSLFYWGEFMRIGDHFHYSDGHLDWTEHLCKDLLQRAKENPWLDNEIIGRLSYIIYIFYESYGGDDRLALLAEEERLPLAVHQHLVYYIRKTTAPIVSEESILPGDEEFHLYKGDDDTDNNRVQILSKEICKRIHEIAFKHLNSISSKDVIKMVF